MLDREERRGEARCDDVWSEPAAGPAPQLVPDYQAEHYPQHFPHHQHDRYHPYYPYPHPAQYQPPPGYVEPFLADEHFESRKLPINPGKDNYKGLSEGLWKRTGGEDDFGEGLNVWQSVGPNYLGGQLDNGQIVQLFVI